ncbi:MAG TPA: hypothetical protein VIS95_06990 [Solirubrobacterales bacterium]
MQRELRAYTETVRHRSGTPDLLVVLADGNAVGPNARRSEIDGLELGEVFPVWIVGVPDPCVEAWLLADSGALKDAFGQSPPSPIPTGSDGLKQYLKSYLEESGEIVTQGGVEFADEIVAAMNLYRAGKNESTLKRFFDDLRAAMK